MLASVTPRILRRFRAFGCILTRRRGVTSALGIPRLTSPLPALNYSSNVCGEGQEASALPSRAANHWIKELQASIVVLVMEVSWISPSCIFSKSISLAAPEWLLSYERNPVKRATSTAWPRNTLLDVTLPEGMSQGSFNHLVGRVQS